MQIKNFRYKLQRGFLQMEKNKDSQKMLAVTIAN